MTYAALPMSLKTTIAVFFFLSMIVGICMIFFVGIKQGKFKLLLLSACTIIVSAMQLLYTSVIRAERAPSYIPAVSLWFEQQPTLLPILAVLAIDAFFVMVLAEENKRRKNAITPSSVKESLDQLETGLCFSQPNGLVLLTNHRMNELSHAILGTALQNANHFWDSLTSKDPSPDVQRITSGDSPEFRLKDGSFWSFRKETLNGVIQITAANVTKQHQLVNELQQKHQKLEEMNARIRVYGKKVDEYIIARERLETRVNLHGFLGQALLMTRHYLQYETGNPQRIIDIWQRNIDVLRMEAEPQPKTDTLASLKNAAEAIGMQVHLSGPMPQNKHIKKLIASMGAETLTNAVRHANARQLWIDAQETDTEFIIRYTNDGTVPSKPISEGGGLSNARKKVEAAGGRMQIDIAPRFMLTIIFGKEEELNA